MRLQHFIYSTLFTLALAAPLAGCHDYADAIEDAREVQYKDEAPIVLALTISSDGHTAVNRPNRSIPLGGEDGDGRERGADQEEKVSDICVYYYDSLDGILSGDATTIKQLFYINDLDKYEGVETEDYGDRVVTRIPIRRSLLQNYTTGEHDQFIVVANMGPIFAPATLGELRNKLVARAWTGTAGTKSTYSRFVMSNERNSVFTEKEGTKSDPHIISVTVERVAARLDFSSCGSNNLYGPGGDAASPLAEGSRCIEYSVKENPSDNSEPERGKVFVTHVRPFNVMQQPTYLIKRLGTSSSASAGYLEYEQPYNSVGFGYVVEPNTWEKRAKNETSKLEEWYDDTRYSEINASYFTDNYRVHVNKATGSDGFTDGYTTVGKSQDLAADITNFYVVDYANENTMVPAATTHETATGYILRAIYVPASVYATKEAAEAKTPKVDCSGGKTFYRYRPMLTNFSEDACVYFTDREEAKRYGDARPATPYVIEDFIGGVCYYITYLRHDSGNDYSPFSPSITPMEYGIVRNNIYRLKCSFTGPGYATIPKEPSLEPLGIRPYIFVRKWYKVEHPEIEI